MRSSDFAISQSNGLMNVRLRNTKKNIMEIDLHRASLFRYSAKFYSMEINLKYCHTSPSDWKYPFSVHVSNLWTKER